jgi:hypothetical protein
MTAAPSGCRCVRGQSCKLTGRSTAGDCRSFRPDVADRHPGPTGRERRRRTRPDSAATHLAALLRPGRIDHRRLEVAGVEPAHRVAQLETVGRVGQLNRQPRRPGQRGRDGRDRGQRAGVAGDEDPVGRRVLGEAGRAGTVTATWSPGRARSAHRDATPSPCSTMSMPSSRDAGSYRRAVYVRMVTGVERSKVPGPSASGSGRTTSAAPDSGKITLRGERPRRPRPDAPHDVSDAWRTIMSWGPAGWTANGENL